MSKANREEREPMMRWIPGQEQPPPPSQEEWTWAVTWTAVLTILSAIAYLVGEMLW